MSDNTQFQLVDSNWNYFSASTLAILAFTIGTKRATQEILEFRVIQVGYFVFAVGNLFGLSFRYKERNKKTVSMEVKNHG